MEELHTPRPIPAYAVLFQNSVDARIECLQGLWHGRRGHVSDDLSDFGTLSSRMMAEASPFQKDGDPTHDTRIEAR